MSFEYSEHFRFSAAVRAQKRIPVATKIETRKGEFRDKYFVVGIDDPSPEKPGAVCSECGRTVTEAEYSCGESTCCKVEVTAEEFYGKEQA